MREDSNRTWTLQDLVWWSWSFTDWPQLAGFPVARIDCDANERDKAFGATGIDPSKE